MIKCLDCGKDAHIMINLVGGENYFLCKEDYVRRKGVGKWGILK